MREFIRERTPGSIEPPRHQDAKKNAEKNFYLRARIAFLRVRLGVLVSWRLN
jgi:hypothetical protein